MEAAESPSTAAAVSEKNDHSDTKISSVPAEETKSKMKTEDAIGTNSDSKATKGGEEVASESNQQSTSIPAINDEPVAKDASKKETVTAPPPVESNASIKPVETNADVKDPTSAAGMDAFRDKGSESKATEDKVDDPSQPKVTESVEPSQQSSKEAKTDEKASEVEAEEEPAEKVKSSTPVSSAENDKTKIDQKKVEEEKPVREQKNLKETKGVRVGLEVKLKSVSVEKLLADNSAKAKIESSGKQVEDEPPKVQVKPKARPTNRKIMKVSTPGAPAAATTGEPATPPSGGTVATPSTAAGKKRGRPTKADMVEREKERQAAIARGEPDPELKRKRRKPNKLAEAGDSPAKKDDATVAATTTPKTDAKQQRKKRKKDKEEEVKEEDAEKKVVKRRKKKVLTQEEIEEREQKRKQQYQEFKAKMKAKKEKREAYLIMKREEKKAQKAAEKLREEQHKQRMAELRAQYLDDNAVDGSGNAPGTPAEFFFDENSQSSLGSQSTNTAATPSTAKKRKNWGDVGHLEMSGIHNPLAHVSAENLFEYKWPLEGRNSEHYFLQEQVTELLQVKSFKRKYPDCPRRAVEADERDFLMEMKIVNEMQADLGLTAIPSSAVLDIMCQDFYEQYEKYMTVLNERKERSLRSSNYASGAGDIKVEEAAKIAADYNKQLNQERNERRSAYFDMQTYRVHYPQNGKGRMRVLKKPKLGNYPVAMIPGQFVDGFKTYTGKELNYFPVNTIMAAPPRPGVTLKDLCLGSDGSESDSTDSSSGSSSDSDSEEEEANTEIKPEDEGRVLGGGEGAETKPPPELHNGTLPPQPPVKPQIKPGSTVAEIRPYAICKMCQGNMKKNKNGLPEMLIHCTKCQQSCHPSCLDLSLDLIKHVTSYQWECTDCKMCLICQDPADEDKMLFCDLCDRGYHIYCVGLEEVPSGRWHCSKCAVCVSCKTTQPFLPGKADQRYGQGGWAHETKINLKGEKVYSHTMCQACHKTWKKGLFCPECNGIFDNKQQKTSNCWVCGRTHHIACVGLDKENERFICGACQRKVQERTVGFRASNGVQGGGGVDGPNTPLRTPSSHSAKTPLTTSVSRSGRRTTQINFANQF